MGEKKVYSDFMIDTETLSRKPNAVVFKIGVCAFCTKTYELGPSRMITLAITDQVLKRDIDPDTIKWWREQSPVAKNQFRDVYPCSTIVALHTLSDFIEKHKAETFYVWGNGSSFDITILETLYDDYYITKPWSYKNIMDLRTFKRFLNIPTVPDLEYTNRTPHCALDDATYQAKEVLQILRHTCVEPA